MNILTTRFGLIQACESDVDPRFRKDCSGSVRSLSYVHLPDPVVSGLSWLQSVTAPELAFGLVAPPLAVSDYRIELRQGDRAALELEDERSALIYVILNRGRRGRADGQPARAAGLQPDPPPGPATGVDLQPLSRAVSRWKRVLSAPAPTLLPGPSPLRATA